MEDNQPKGIGFYNIKSGETHYARSGAQIQAFINSSDLGINASRGQDFGWRLAPIWIQKIKAFRQDETKMDNLATKLRLDEEQSPSLMQILYALYGQELRLAKTRSVEGENPFEQEYLQNISKQPEAALDNVDERLEDLPIDEPAPEEFAEPVPPNAPPAKPKPSTKNK